MSNRTFAIKVLEDAGEIIIRCNGNSMRPIIAPKEAIHLKRVIPAQIREGDAVFCRINGNLQVHLVSAIDKERFQISNNKGHVNGWIRASSIFGLAVQIEDRVLVSPEDLAKRLEEYKHHHHGHTTAEMTDKIEREIQFAIETSTPDNRFKF